MSDPISPTPPAPPAAATPPRPAPPLAAAASGAPARPIHEMRFGSYPLFVLFWPLVLGGELCALALAAQPEWSENVAWVYITILCTCFVAVGFDVGRNLAIGWGLFVALCWVGGLYLREAREIPVLSALRDFLAGFDAAVAPGFIHAVALLVTLGLIGVYVNVWINHRWRVTHNELHIVKRGESEDAITRGAKRISVEYPDVFELLLLGAGHVVVRDSKGRDEIRRIPRVPFLLLREKQLDQIAEAWAVTSAPTAAMDDEEA